MMQFANPARFLALSAWLAPWSFALGLGLTLSAWAWGLFWGPSEAYQGDSARILYIHVPSAVLSYMLFFAMAAASAIGLVWRHIVADFAAKAVAPIGASFTAICLVSGSLWGYPTWGAFWVWDARLTSELILLFLYFGYLSIWALIEDEEKAARLAAILAMIGLINIPIIVFSVQWWDTLHQGRSLFTRNLSPAFGIPLRLSMLGLALLALGLWLWNIRAEIFRRQAQSGERALASASGRNSGSTLTEMVPVQTDPGEPPS